MIKKLESLKSTLLPQNPDVSHMSVSRTTLLASMAKSQKLLRVYADDPAARGSARGAVAQWPLY